MTFLQTTKSDDFLDKIDTVEMENLGLEEEDNPLELNVRQTRSWMQEWILDPYLNIHFDILQLKKKGGWLDLLLFLGFDIVFITVDVGLDILTSIQFFMEENPFWGSFNVCFIFFPALMRFIVRFAEDFSAKKAVKKSVLCLPFVQTWHAINRFTELREQSVFLTSVKKLTSVKRESAFCTIYEGFLEASSSQVLIMSIFFMSGMEGMTNLRIASICTSIIALSLTAERVFFMFRSVMDTDNDPSWRLKLLVFPCMLLNIFSSTVLWSLIAANVKSGIVYCVLFSWVFNWSILKSCNSAISTKILFSSPLLIALLTTLAPSAFGADRKMFMSMVLSSYSSKMIMFTVIYWLRWNDASFLPVAPSQACTGCPTKDGVLAASPTEFLLMACFLIGLLACIGLAYLSNYENVLLITEKFNKACGSLIFVHNSLIRNAVTEGTNCFQDFLHSEDGQSLFNQFQNRSAYNMTILAEKAQRLIKTQKCLTEDGIRAKILTMDPKTIVASEVIRPGPYGTYPMIEASQLLDIQLVVSLLRISKRCPVNDDGEGILFSASNAVGEFYTLILEKTIGKLKLKDDGMNIFQFLLVSARELDKRYWDRILYYARKAADKVDLKNRYGETALHQVEDEFICNVLIELGANLEAIDNRHMTPLHNACISRNEKVALTLIAKGANVHARSLTNNTPLHYATRGSRINLVDILLKAGSDVNAAGKENKVILHLAAGSGNEDLVHLLLTRGANISSVDKHGYTALHLAARKGYTKIVEILLKHGSDVNAMDAFWETPLHHACKTPSIQTPHPAFRGVGRVNAESKTDTVLLLLQKGANVNSVGYDDKTTPLHLASANGFTQLVQRLLDYGADVNAVDIRLNTPLILAAEMGHISIVETLTKHPEINLDSVNSSKSSALFLACEKNHPDVVKRLLASGADKLIKNEWGTTAMDIAIHKKRTECKKLLMQYEPKQMLR